MLLGSFNVVQTFGRGRGLSRCCDSLGNLGSSPGTLGTLGSLGSRNLRHKVLEDAKVVSASIVAIFQPAECAICPSLGSIVTFLSRVKILTRVIWSVALLSKLAGNLVTRAGSRRTTLGSSTTLATRTTLGSSTTLATRTTLADRRTTVTILARRRTTGLVTLRRSLGLVTLSLGRVTMSLGRVTLSLGRVTMSLGRVTLSLGRVTLSLGRVTMSLGRVTRSLVLGVVTPTRSRVLGVGVEVHTWVSHLDCRVNDE